MAVLTSVSGLNGKLPAAFVLELHDKRILLDLGEGPEPGVRPDAAKLGHVDAIFLSHAHVDHVGSMDLWESLGSPPVYASAATFRGLAPQGINLPAAACHELPLVGAVDIIGLPFTVGRSGHAIGGLWLHTEDNGGILYMGDWSRETTILAFDAPPNAATVITDVSYCDRPQTLAEQIDALALDAPAGAVLPVPPMGRGTELALRLTEAGRDVAVCPVVAREIQMLADDHEGHVSEQTREALTRLLPNLADAADAGSDKLIVVVEAEHKSSILPSLIEQEERHFILTGHVAANSLGDRLLQQKRASRMPWNVHPPRGCNLWLADAVHAERVLPAFGAISDAPHLAAGLGPRLNLSSPLAL
jgi:hypothetical protein